MGLGAYDYITLQKKVDFDRFIKCVLNITKDDLGKSDICQSFRYMSIAKNGNEAGFDLS